MTEQIFIQGLQLIEVVTQKQFTSGQSKAYNLLLKDISDDDFMQGIETLLKERVYTNIPSPAEIRDYCLGTREDDLTLRASEASLKLKRALSGIGTYATVAFDDPIIHLVVKSWGGWCKLGTMAVEEFEDKLKWELPKLYKAYASRKNGEIPLMLEGRGDDKTVNFIGNKEKALKWMGAYQNKLEQKKQNLIA